MEYTSLGIEHGGHKSGSSLMTTGWETTAPNAHSGVQHATKGRRHSRWSDLNAFDLAADFVSLALPLGLLGFLIAVVQLDGSRIVDSGALGRWQNAISILATLFPMFFASVVGRMVYELARWKLEKGSSLGSLEQLLGSRTFGGTLITQIHLPAFNLLALGLVFIWAFSPLGAQSILRILESPFEPQFATTDVQYQDLTQGTSLSRTSLVSSGSAKGARARFKYRGTMFSTLLQVPSDVQVDTMDLWGNVRIPRLPDAATGGSAEWQDIVWSDDLERFSSLAGIPITTFPVGNGTVELESAYLDLACSNITKGSMGSSSTIDFDWDWPNFWTSSRDLVPEKGNGSWQGIGNNRTKFPDAGVSTDGDKASWGIALDRFVDSYWINGSEQYRRWGVGAFDTDNPDLERLQNALNSPALLIDETGIEAGPTKLLFDAYLDEGTNVPGYRLTAYCDVKQRYVESRVECRRNDASSRQNCTAIAHRPSQKVHPPEDVSYISFPEVFMHLATRMPMASNADIGAGDTVVRWLDAMQLTSNIGGHLTMFTDVDEGSFSRRFSQVLNSYIVLSTFDTGEGAQGGVRMRPNITAEVTVSTLEPTYRLAKHWVALAFLCCGVLLAGGVLGVVFAHLAQGPEVLGYASAVVRDSKLMDMPPEVGHMSGIQISREMRDLRVRYGYSELTLTGRRLTGVGREHETAPI